MAKNKKRKLHPASRENRAKDHSVQKAKIRQQTLPVVPFFDSEERILLVGEGDFSFARSIVENHGCSDVTATCLDAKAELYEKYKPQAEQNVQYLEDEGQIVLYGVDATRLDSNKALNRGQMFDRIVFNFPHVGGKSKDVNRQVRFNQELIVKFFATAMALLTQGGTIVMTLFEGEPYTLWNIRDLARHSGLELQRSFKFVPDLYPGYGHSRTLGNIEGGGGWKGEDRDARSYVFQKKASQQSLGGARTKKRKNRADEYSSGEDR